MKLSQRALKTIAAVTGISLLVMLFRFFSRLSSLLPVLIGLSKMEAGSFGVMGSADGPTAIFTTTKLSPPLAWLFFACALAEAALHIFLLVKSVKALRCKR